LCVCLCVCVCVCVCVFVFVYVRALVRSKPRLLISRKYIFESEAPKKLKVYGYNKDKARKICADQARRNSMIYIDNLV